MSVLDRINFASTDEHGNNDMSRAITRPLSLSDIREVQKHIENPSSMSTTAKTLLGQDDEKKVLARAGFGNTAHEELLNVYDLDSSEWNDQFFGSPSKTSYSLLMDSIIRDGLLSPITVWKQKDLKRYTILSGHTRARVFFELYQASNDERWKFIPAYVYEYEQLNENSAKCILIAANLAQRAQEPPKTRVKCYAEYARLIKQKYSYGSGKDTNEETAEALGVHRATVALYRRLENLLDPILDLYSNGTITQNIAVGISSLDKSLQEFLLRHDCFKMINRHNIRKIAKAKTVEELESMLSAPDEDSIEHRYSFGVPFEKPSGCAAVGLILPEDDIKAFKTNLAKVANQLQLSDRGRDLILKSLQNSSGTIE